MKTLFSRHWKRFLTSLTIVVGSTGIARVLVPIVRSIDLTDKAGANHRRACGSFLADCETSAPFIFDAVHGLLKQWPNSLAQNGHSVVRAVVPPNTPLYNVRHDTHGETSPKKPTFFSFDAEMGLGIYGSVGTPYLHTMITTRPLAVLYFDGSSATLTGAGTLDSQMALLRGPAVAIDDADVYDEDLRRLGLCGLAESLRLDGVVRMNAGFELLVCDHDRSGVRRVSERNVTFPTQELRDGDASLPRDPTRSPPHGFGTWFAEQNSFEWIRSAAWHYHGEHRVKLDLCGMVTFYDPALRSLSGLHHSRLIGNDSSVLGWGLRRGHRLVGIDQTDVDAVKAWLSKISARPTSSLRPCSGTDWRTVTELVVQTHRDRLLQVHDILSRYTTTDAAAVLTKIHELSHAALYQFLEYPTIADKPLTAIHMNTIASCASLLVDHIDARSMSEFEVLIRDSIRIVTWKLCSLEWDLFEWSERRTVNQLDPTSGVDEMDTDREMRRMTERTLAVLKWIGWDTPTSCEPTCKLDELCYLPMWPVVYAPHQRQGGIFNGETLTPIEEREFWRPKCISRHDFDRGGGRGRDPWNQLPDVDDVPYGNQVSLVVSP